MSHENPDEKSRPESVSSKVAEGEAALPLAVTGNVAGEVPPAKALTPEEQMALYEKDLKENDWGHQPC